MPFDHIIMNPPYSGNLHLKILREAMKHVEKDGGELVNLSPISKVQAKFLLDKDYKDLDFINHCEVHIDDVIICDEAMKLFSLESLGQDLGIWRINVNGKTDFKELENEVITKYKDLIYKMKSKRYEKSFESLKSHLQLKVKVEPNKPFLKFVYGLTLAVHGGHCWSAWSICSRVYETATTFTPGIHTAYLIAEDKDYIAKLQKLYTSSIMRFYCKYALIGGPFYDLIPYFENGDEDLTKYFGLTESEVKLIEEEMK